MVFHLSVTLLAYVVELTTLHVVAPSRPIDKNIANLPRLRCNSIKNSGRDLSWEGCETQMAWLQSRTQPKCHQQQALKFQRDLCLSSDSRSLYTQLFSQFRRAASVYRNCFARRAHHHGITMFKIRTIPRRMNHGRPVASWLSTPHSIASRPDSRSSKRRSTTRRTFAPNTNGSKSNAPLCRKSVTNSAQR